MQQEGNGPLKLAILFLQFSLSGMLYAFFSPHTTPFFFCRGVFEQRNGSPGQSWQRKQQGRQRNGKEKQKAVEGCAQGGRK